MGDQLLTVQELANYLQVPISRVYALSHRHQIPFVKISHRCLRFKKCDIEAWLEQKSQPAEGGDHVR